MSPTEAVAPGKADAKRGTAKERSIQSCNFRSAGRLSNENARALTTLFETFARNLASSLDVFLGTGLEVKLKSLDQQPVKEHIAAIPALSYLVPFTLAPAATTMIVECDINIIFPIIELLLGGTGSSQSDARELSEIEEEIMQDVIALIARQAEQAWRLKTNALSAGRRVKPSQLHQYCPANEKFTMAKFEMEIAGSVGSFLLAFPASFLNVLLSQIKADQPQKKGGLRYFPSAGIRERIVDCDFNVAVCLPEMKVAVRDLVALQPGSVLKLRAPVRGAGTLTIEGQEIFEAVPVRNGTQKAAQLGRRTTRSTWEGE